MLVLTRKRNQKVFIGENIAVTVVEIRGDKVRLGFDAPCEIVIERDDCSQRVAARKRKGPKP